MQNTLAIKNFLKQYWFIIILTIIAAFLRLYNIKPTISFLGDQGRDVRIVRDLLLKADPILVGPTTSVGKIQLGPLYYYFMAPWLWLFDFDPVGPAVGVAFLGIITIPILYYVIRKMFNQNTAIFTSILYTFSSVVIHNTRFSWNPNPMPLPAILFIYSLYQAYRNQNRKQLILSFLWFGIMFQLHYMVLLLIPFFLIMLLLISKKFDKTIFVKSLAAGALVTLLLLSPLIVFDLRHDFLNTKGFLEFFQKGHHSPQVWYQPITDLKRRAGESIGNIIGLSDLGALRNYLAIFLTITTLIFWRLIKHKGLTVISLYILFSLIGLSLYRGDVFIHYLGFFFPVPFIILGIMLDYLWSKGKLFLKAAVIGIITAYLIMQYKPQMLYRPLGWQIDDVKKISGDVAYEANQPYNIVLLDDTKDYPGMSYRYFLEMTSHPPANELNYNGVKVLYIISQYEDLSKVNLEVRELETFAGQKINNLQNSDDTAIITEKIVKSWNYQGGPWVYKLQRD